MLAECVASLARAGVDHVVAADGAYMLFPGAHAWSRIEQHETITAVCRGHRVGLTLYVPSEPWVGNETEKRTALFRLGELVADDGWLWVIDADEVVTQGPSRSDLVALHESDFDVAELRFCEAVDSALVDQTQTPERRLFRSGLGVTVGPAHYDYRAADGRLLRGRGVQEPAMDLLSVRMEHRPAIRSLERMEHKRTYNSLRNRLGVEQGVQS